MASPVSRFSPDAGRINLVFAANADGGTYLERQFASYPFHICRLQYQDSGHPGLATLYLQSCSGGLYEDDRLDIGISMREGADAHVSTQSATVVHTMPSGCAKQSVRILCEGPSYLEYLPDPQILFPGSRCESKISARICRGAVVLVADSFLQHDPDAGAGSFASYASEIVIEGAAGEALAVDRLRIEGAAAQIFRPGNLGRFAAQGTLIIAGLDVASSPVADALRRISPEDGEARIGASLLPKSAGIVVRVLALDGASLKRAMHLVWCAARRELKGSLPAERRK